MVNIVLSIAQAKKEPGRAFLLRGPAEVKTTTS
jgi:hypothetical protein